MNTIKRGEKSLYHFFTGKIKLTFSVNKFEMLVNRLRLLIPIYSIAKRDTVVELTTGYRYKKSVISVLDEFGAEILSVKSYGVPSYVDRYKKRVGIFIGIIMLTVGLIVSSLLIWEVRISGNEYLFDEEIVNLLKKQGIAEGCFIDKEILETAYNDILIAEPRLSWISVNYDGTVANVEVKETELVPEVLDRNKNINITAKCDGVIKRIDVFDGKAEASAGDTVTKGTLLISSFTESRKTGVFMRAARGNIWALTDKFYEINIKKNNKTAHLSDSKQNRSTVIVLGRRIPLFITKNSGLSQIETDINKRRFKLLDTFNMPFVIETKADSKIEIQNIDLSYKEAEIIAEKELIRRIEKDLDGCEVIEKTCDTFENQDEYIFIYKLNCLENIACSNEFDYE